MNGLLHPTVNTVSLQFALWYNPSENVYIFQKTFENFLFNESFGRFVMSAASVILVIEIILVIVTVSFCLIISVII